MSNKYRIIIFLLYYNLSYNLQVCSVNNNFSLLIELVSDESLQGAIGLESSCPTTTQYSCLLELFLKYLTKGNCKLIPQKS